MLLTLLSLLPEPDLSVLEEQADAGLTDMPGCFDVQAEVVLSYRVVGVVTDTERFAMDGRIEDGVWTSLTPTLVDPGKVNSTVGFGDMPFVPPMFGMLASGVVAEGPGNLLALLISSTRADVGVTSASLGTSGADEVYVFSEAHSARAGRGEVEQRVWLTPAGQVLRAQLRIDHARTENGVVVRELATEQELDGSGLPTSERLFLKLRSGPMTMRLAQELVYTSWVPCT